MFCVPSGQLSAMDRSFCYLDKVGTQMPMKYSALIPRLWFMGMHLCIKKYGSGIAVMFLIWWCEKMVSILFFSLAEFRRLNSTPLIGSLVKSLRILRHLPVWYGAEKDAKRTEHLFCFQALVLVVPIQICYGTEMFSLIGSYRKQKWDNFLKLL